MKTNNSANIFIIIAGSVIVLVFAFVLKNNLSPNYESRSYYAKPEEQTTARIEKTYIENNKLVVLTSSEAVALCVKTTKTLPDSNHICWKSISSGKNEQSVYKEKQYYLWVKDKDGKLSPVLNIYTK